MKKLSLCLLFLAALVFTGCENSVNGSFPDDATISFTTFNARMTDELPLRTKRFKKMKPLFAEVTSDIFCIQDLYGNDVLEKTREMLRDEYGFDFQLYAKTSNKDEDLEYTEGQTIPPACTMNDLAPVLSCVLTECPDYQPMCLIQNCGPDFLELPADCRNCMLSQGFEAIQNGNYLEVLEACQQSERIPAKRLEYEYSGNNGILLVSKLPMKNKSSVKLRSYCKLRTALSVVVEKPKLGNIQVICTSLSPLSDEEYNGFGESWKDEQLTQVEQLLSIPVEENVSQRVILGDLNSNFPLGEDIPDFNTDPVGIFQLNGWYDPYFKLYDTEESEASEFCTVCEENPFVSGINSVPDHILFQTKKGYTFESYRSLYNLFTELDYDAHTKTSYSVSDHYGITTVMSLK
ncbi:hypothetical protein IKR20_02875 [bacterium]|nr:hypothetical protein [bacterium]